MRIEPSGITYLSQSYYLAGGWLDGGNLGPSKGGLVEDWTRLCVSLIFQGQGLKGVGDSEEHIITPAAGLCLTKLLTRITAHRLIYLWKAGTRRRYI